MKWAVKNSVQPRFLPDLIQARKGFFENPSYSPLRDTSTYKAWVWENEPLPTGINRIIYELLGLTKGDRWVPVFPDGSPEERKKRATDDCQKCIFFAIVSLLQTKGLKGEEIVRGRIINSLVDLFEFMGNESPSFRKFASKDAVALTIDGLLSETDIVKQVETYFPLIGEPPKIK